MVLVWFHGISMNFISYYVIVSTHNTHVYNGYRYMFSDKKETEITSGFSDIITENFGGPVTMEEEGKYYLCVVAINNAMSVSKVRCSDVSCSLEHSAKSLDSCRVHLHAFVSERTRNEFAK